MQRMCSMNVRIRQEFNISKRSQTQIVKTTTTTFDCSVSAECWINNDDDELLFICWMLEKKILCISQFIQFSAFIFISNRQQYLHINLKFLAIEIEMILYFSIFFFAESMEESSSKPLRYTRKNISFFHMQECFFMNCWSTSQSNYISHSFRFVFYYFEWKKIVWN